MVLFAFLGMASVFITLRSMADSTVVLKSFSTGEAMLDMFV